MGEVNANSKHRLKQQSALSRFTCTNISAPESVAVVHQLVLLFTNNTDVWDYTSKSDLFPAIQSCTDGLNS